MSRHEVLYLSSPNDRPVKAIGRKGSVLSRELALKEQKMESTVAISPIPQKIHRIVDIPLIPPRPKSPHQVEKDRQSKAVRLIFCVLKNTGYSVRSIGETFGTTEIAVSRIIRGATKHVPAFLIKRVFETDPSTMPPPAPSEPRERQKPALGAKIEDSILVRRKDGVPDLPPQDRDPRHHAKHWFDTGFSVLDIAQIAHVSAGDVERLLNGCAVGNYSSGQLVNSYPLFESHLTD